MPNPPQFKKVVGPHLASTHPISERFSYADGHSQHGVPTRALSETNSDVDQFVAAMREYLRTHHSSPESLERDRQRRKAYARQGLVLPHTRFPTNPTTRKGNWAEIFLSEYVATSCNADLHVYRLRYNPNIDQSMKGDDVLAFDLDANPVRIIVGEAKFRGRSSKKAVIDIVESLERSFQGGLPASLQFVADRIIEQGNKDLGQRIEECAGLIARGNLQIDYIGLLASNHLAPTHVEKHAHSSLRRLAVISMALSDGAGLVDSCFDGLEDAP